MLEACQFLLSHFSHLVAWQPLVSKVGSRIMVIMVEGVWCSRSFIVPSMPRRAMPAKHRHINAMGQRLA